MCARRKKSRRVRACSTKSLFTDRSLYVSYFPSFRRAMLPLGPLLTSCDQANICLAILQVYGAAASGSLALFTTMADAIFDPLSNLTLILCHRAVNRVDPRRFPSGKARIENAGNISFCFLMMAVSLVLIVLSIKELAGNNGGLPTSEFHVRSNHPRPNFTHAN